MTFIYTIHPIITIINVNEQNFCRFYRTGALIMIDTMVSLINTVI